MSTTTDIFGRTPTPTIQPVGAVVRLVLPWPPSANSYWKHSVIRGRVITYLSPEAKAFKSAVRVVCARAGVRPLDGRVKVAMRLYRPTQNGDGDNYMPLVLDGIQGHAYHNDRQVKRYEVDVLDDRFRPRVEVEVTPLENLLFNEVG